MCRNDMSAEIGDPRASDCGMEGSVSSGRKKKSILIAPPPPLRVITNNNGMMVSRASIPTSTPWKQSSRRAPRPSSKPASRNMQKSGTVKKLVGVWEKKVTEASEKTQCGCGRPGCRGAVGCEARMSWQVMVGRVAVKLRKQREMRERAILEANVRMKSRDLDAELRAMGFDAEKGRIGSEFNQHCRWAQKKETVIKSEALKGAMVASGNKQVASAEDNPKA